MRDSRDFQAVRRRGKKISTQYTVIHISVGLFAPKAPRVGITVGKDCGNSVSRHRISRRLRGVLRDIIPHLPQGTGLVIKARPQIMNAVNVHDHLHEALSGYLS